MMFFRSALSFWLLFGAFLRLFSFSRGVDMRFFSVFFLLCCFFSGLSGRAFAIESRSCEDFADVLAADDSGGIQRVLVEGGLSIDEASDACHSAPNAACSVCNEDNCWSYGYSCDSGTCQDFWSTCSYSSDPSDPCEDRSPTPLEDCLSEKNITWMDSSTCSYICKCDNYTGQEVFNFTYCRDDIGDSACFEEAAAACDGSENVDWISKSDCQYNCVGCDEYEENCSARYADFGGASSVCYEDENGYAASFSCDPMDCYTTAGEAGYTCDSYCFYTVEHDSEGCAKYRCDCLPEDFNTPDPDTPGDPTPDPEDDPENDKTCVDYEAECSNSCQFSCATDSETGKVTYHNCDCADDPSDPGLDGESGTDDDGETGSADDGANGWLKQIEDNTDKTASGVEVSNNWLKAIKKNADILIENDQKYFSSNGKSVFKHGDGKSVFLDGDKRSAFVDEKGVSYLRSISQKVTEASVDMGEIVLPEDNEYSSALDETDEQGQRILQELPTDSFETKLTNYIATGIPLFGYIKNTSIHLSSASSSLSLSIFGHPVFVDFAPYESTINQAGDILFYLTILSSFLIIIMRAKG
jgi:hypothetical protein